MIIFSFLLFLAVITGVGVYSAKLSKGTTEDYIVGGRDIGPIPTALSAVSTCHSGFMFVGMIGYTYTQGISALWLIIAWMIGDFVAWKTVHSRLRNKSESENAITIADFIASHLTGRSRKLVRAVAAVFILMFLSVYAAAQLTAGSKALSVMLGWPTYVGIIVGAVIVTAYSFAGGIRASIWTDVVQSILMVFSMILLLLIAIVEVGGFASLFQSLNSINPSLTQLIPTDTGHGFLLFFLGWIAFGFGVIGQPHIMVRPMSITGSEHMKKARHYYFVWYLIFSISSVGVGLTARVLLPGLLGVDAELALPQLATTLLPSLLVGAILAGLFSATISTADSQILSCSSAITQDILPEKHAQKLGWSKSTTLLTMVIVTLVALFGSNSVYVLVIVGWSGLAAVLAPPILLKCYNKYFSAKDLLIVMVAGFLTVCLWTQVWKLSGSINETLPAFLVTGAIIGIVLLKKGQNTNS